MALGGTAACTSILGDFQTGMGATPGPDASSDGQAQSDGNVGPVSDGAVDGSDGAATTDGPAIDGADAADLLLKCDGLRFPNPIQIDSLASAPSGFRTYQDRPGLATVSQDVARIVLRKQGASGFTVYTIDKNNPQNGSGSFTVSSNVSEDQFRATATGAALLATVYGQQNELDLYTLPSTLGPTGPVPTPTQLVKPGGVPSSTSNFQANFFEINGATDVFYALAFQDPTTASNSLQVGRARGAASSPTQLAIAPKQFDSLAMLHVGTSMRIFSSGDPSSGGAVVYSTPDDGTVAALATPRTLSQTASVPALLLDAVQGPGKGYNLAFIELDTTSTTALATFRVGTVDPTNIDTFVAHDLPLGPVLNDASLLPVDKGTSAWYGDDLVAIGKGSPATYPGLNWIWMDASGNVRAQNVGTNAILSTRTNVGTAVASPSQKLGVKYQTWNIVWTETMTDANGAYDVVYLNELICH